ncbi:MAG TPA: orotidine-5'-phosphate decarboxylase [Pirellulaceae bacterium]|jgi:orotidine-5'-phosphate decarboxylase|nr:orotidine-5'-phosphate decarboxylase [Pirellulaceae bacterium]
MGSSFSDRLADAVRRTRTPLVVGIDPRADRLPHSLLPQEAYDDHAAVAEAYATFGEAIVEIAAGRVCAVKPQLAFFEECGPAGATALARVAKAAREQGLLVIFDGKRSDIDSTAEGYARAYLGAKSAWGADALTVSPYLGGDSLDPFERVAVEQDAGLFVLVKTSNPGGKMFQDLQLGERRLFEHVAAYVEERAKATAGACGYGVMGAVVGATYPAQLEQLRREMPSAWFLIPGFGAQGGAAKEIVPAWDGQGLGGVVNSSRKIIFAYRDAPYAAKFGEANWKGAVSAAIDEARAAFASAHAAFSA